MIKGKEPDWVPFLLKEWCGRKDLNLHSEETAPKTVASANSATPALEESAIMQLRSKGSFITAQTMIANKLLFWYDKNACIA